MHDLLLPNLLDHTGAEDGPSRSEEKKMREKPKAMQQLLQDFEEQMEREIYKLGDQVSVSSTEVEEHSPEQDTIPEAYRALMTISEEDTKDDGTPVLWEAEPKLFQCDDWIMPVEVSLAETPR